MDTELKNILHDELFDSREWLHGDTLDRIHWLVARVKTLEQESELAWEMCERWHTAYDTVKSLKICEE